MLVAAADGPDVAARAAAGLVAIVVLSLLVGLLPALRARRLKIVDALAGR